MTGDGGDRRLAHSILNFVHLVVKQLQKPPKPLPIHFDSELQIKTCGENLAERTCQDHGPRGWIILRALVGINDLTGEVVIDRIYRSSIHDDFCDIVDYVVL